MLTAEPLANIVKLTYPHDLQISDEKAECIGSLVFDYTQKQGAKSKAEEIAGLIALVKKAIKVYEGA